MTPELLDRIPLGLMEVEAVRDGDGAISDLRWSYANATTCKFMSRDGAPLVGATLSSVLFTGRDGLLYRKSLEAIETGKIREYTAQSAAYAELEGWLLRAVIAPFGDKAMICFHPFQLGADTLEGAETADLLALFRAAFDKAPQGISLTLESGKIVFSNAAAHILLGYEPGSLEGVNIDRIQTPEYSRRLAKIGHQLVTGERAEVVEEWELIGSDGKPVLLSMATSCMFSKLRGEQVFITHTRDVRQEHQHREQLQAALDRAEQATRLKSEFLANMSHEIRTPLNGVLGMAQVLAMGPLSEAQAGQVDVILESGNTLMVLLNDILDLSKIEAGKMEVSPVAGDVRHKLSSLHKLHAAAAREKGIGLQLFVHPSVPSSLEFDPVRVRQCVGNLVSNAIKFTAKGEVMIVVTAEPQADGNYKVIIHVSDTGCGIAPDKIERVFESFAQEDGSTTRRFGGTGLGLAITRQLARIMGGDVSAASQPGRGSVFTLTFMAAADMPDATSHNPVVALRKPHLRQGLSGGLALIVDDNAINRRVVRSFLDAYKLDAEEAEDGNAALDLLAVRRFDIVLMDIHMPVLDGHAALQRLRTLTGLNRHTPVIALTADSMHGDRERLLADGFNGYISKPIAERALISEISQVLSQNRDFGEWRVLER